MLALSIQLIAMRFHCSFSARVSVFMFDSWNHKQIVSFPTCTNLVCRCTCMYMWLPGIIKEIIVCRLLNEVHNNNNHSASQNVTGHSLLN